MIRVAVAGARGMMGAIAVSACTSTPGVAYAGGFARTADPANRIVDSLDELFANAGVDVVLDLTTQPKSVEVATTALRSGVRPVVGASGWSDADRARLRTLAQERSLGAMIVPNFSLGAIVAMRLAAEASKYFPNAEIVEMHRVEKKDKPSGTALETARRMIDAGAAQPAIHSVRLPGLVAHQEILFSGEGELLTIRHDSFSRASFVAGMMAAVRAVMHRTGLTIGLDAVL
ncbi:MAG TPA: dihydrodipicolinate reductase C-terminal domain-containing protein, partial [Candidatus Tumulicola sp.]